MNRASRIEDEILARIDRERAPKPLRDACEARSALEAAYHAYAAKWGWPEAKTWAAARANWRPAEHTSGAISFAEQHFTKRAANG